MIDGTDNFLINNLSILEKTKGILQILWMLKRMRKRTNFKLKELSDNLVGNPYTYNIFGNHITECSIRNYYYMRLIESIFPENSSINVLEIGGGFGSLCRNLMMSNKINVQNLYFIDLPESMMLAYYYLNNSGIDTIVFNRKNISNTKKVVICPPWLLKYVKNKFDLVINTMSFQHMSIENLIFYFSQINRLNIDKIFLVNRNIEHDKSDIRADNYPIDKSYKLTKESLYPFSVTHNYLERLYTKK
ncbi:MAG: putative sugar O-methyltransferase [Candidatus Aenigmatarchaeota archaeon]